jgi:hypothetical protein
MPKHTTSASCRYNSKPFHALSMSLLALLVGCASPQQTGPNVPAKTADPGNDIFFLPGGKTLVVPAFRVYVASGYTPSKENVATLAKVAGTNPSFRMVEFDGGADGNARLWCRGSFPVNAPNKLPFDKMLEAAANLEFAQAKVLGEQVDDKVKAHLDHFDFTSFGTGSWKIRSTFSAVGKQPVVIEHTHTYELSLLAAKSCDNVVANLIPAISGFWRTAYGTPQFVALMAAPATVTAKQ